MDEQDDEAVDFGGSAGNNDFGRSFDGTGACSFGTRSRGPRTASRTTGTRTTDRSGKVPADQSEELYG